MVNTRAIEKGVPPRVHDPKGTSKKNSTLATKNKKRPREPSTSDEDCGDDNSSEEEEVLARAQRKKKKARRKHAEELDDEIEVVEEDVVPPEEVVETIRDNRDSDEEDDGLNEHQRGAVLEEKVVKKDSTRDILMIMSDKVTVKFMEAKDKMVTEKGRWCNVCKNDESFVKVHGKRKAFHKGGNSSCRQHIRQHYPQYKDACEQAKVEMNHWAMPRAMWKMLEDEKDSKNRGKMTKKEQQQLSFQTVTGPREFTRAGTLHAVAKLIATNNLPLALANNTAFRNSLVAMRPKSTMSDLPSTYDVKIHIHNQFVMHMNALKDQIAAAPGKVSITSDAWSADTTKMGFQGTTAHWIEVKEGKWTIKAAVIGFKALSGAHTGQNLGRYAVGLLDRVGVMNKKTSKLYTVTLDNTGNNNMTCRTIEDVHRRRGLEWKSAELQLPCLAHVVNLGNVDVMSQITKIAAVENATAIWEYDPTQENNRVLGGSLDVIAAIRTLAIKIQASGQRIEYFDSTQIRCGHSDPVKIPLHSNIRWGTAYKMLDQANRLRQPVALFLTSADELFGPITTLRRNNLIAKRIPWAAFKLNEQDWVRVVDARDILGDSNRIQQCFSSEKQPTLWRALPALEALQTAWERKASSPRYTLYKDALTAGLAKLKKYYSRLDEKPSFILALVLHPYYKLAYIKSQWGGPEEQAAEIKAGNADARDWQDEAKQIVEKTMAEYYRNRPSATSTTGPRLSTQDVDSDDVIEMPAVLSDFDKHRESLLSDDTEEGWASELRRYLSIMQRDVTKETDIIEWWQDNGQFFPTLARIALDVLPSQASAVPCERLFSGTKQIATDRRACLGPTVFEELAIMRSAWGPDLYDHAAWNTSQVEEANLFDFEEMLGEDVKDAAWDKELDKDYNMEFIHQY